jgi:hypothetical protein
MKKRQIISPFTFSYFYARYLKLRLRDTKLVHYEKSETTIDKLMIKVSYYDFKLLSGLSAEFYQGFERFNKFYDEYTRTKKLDLLSERQSSDLLNDDREKGGILHSLQQSMRHRRTAVRRSRKVSEEESKASLLEEEEPKLRKALTLLRKS